MPRVYELPTHLQVEDALLLGLTPRQLVRLAVGASLAYGAWDQAAGLPPGLRITLTAVLALLGLLLALVRPGGRPLDQWLLAALFFTVQPRRRLWARVSSAPGPARPGAGEGWAELTPQPAWIVVDPSASHPTTPGPRP